MRNEWVGTQGLVGGEGWMEVGAGATPAPLGGLITAAEGGKKLANSHHEKRSSSGQPLAPGVPSCRTC